VTGSKAPSGIDDRFQSEKQAAARAALGYVRSGMVLGLGSGSTAGYFIDMVAERIRSGELMIEAVPSSVVVAAKAKGLGIPICEPGQGLRVDLTVDGADEIAPDLSLIKGAGGALLREKVLAEASRNFLVIADSSKYVDQLGRKVLPVEVVPFALPWAIDHLEELDGSPALRMDPGSPGKAFLTDQQNYIVDCRFGLIEDPESLAARLKRIPGLIEHGLFLGYARAALIATGGNVNAFRPGKPPVPVAEFTL
jgi:ribose 5-phosphate isomerase A